MVVLGQLVPGVDIADLHAGQRVELVLGTLYSDDEHEYLVWKWQPIDDKVPAATATGSEVPS